MIILVALPLSKRMDKKEKKLLICEAERKSKNGG